MTYRQASRVLVIAAHPDDIEIGAGGAIAQWTDAGVAVTFCLVTDGSSGSNDPNMDTKELIQIRQREQREAASHIGVTDIRHLNYPDGVLEPTIALRRDLTRLIREVRPDRVVITDPTTILVEEEGFHYINHPDHRAAAEASLYAVFPSAESRPIFAELLEEGLEPFHVNEVWMMLTTKPNVVLDISQQHERKLKSILCHRSQLDEEAIGFVRTMDARVGERIGAAYGEEFRVMTFYYDPPPASE
jgi:LmbE family N-acetylglucosaminyl deacetylase